MSSIKLSYWVGDFKKGDFCCFSTLGAILLYIKIRKVPSWIFYWLHNYRKTSNGDSSLIYEKSPSVYNYLDIFKKLDKDLNQHNFLK